ncbi:hypothetical protein FE257_011306 [Aspergillus nanangensis]|uniref:Uncharacterized protein n=1 Tax=Aspergillus nanangensis TaxID=2582783 RepID=A0AAD4CHE6_ASPNN|nr:hypothetical protein FE257_011306 [Aspergillus nanangensis]
MEDKDQPPTTTSKAKHNDKRENIQPTPPLSMARFWAQKAECLEGPFDMPTGLVPMRELKDAVAQHITGKTEDTSAPTAPPLTNDAIADILKKTKPDCPRAQAWIQAHEIAKAARERMNGRIEDCDELRKKVARRLRDKARQVATNSGAPKNEIKAFLEELAEEDRIAAECEADADNGKEKSKDAKDDSPEAVFERVCIAHERLNKTIAEIQEWRKNR